MLANLKLLYFAPTLTYSINKLLYLYSILDSIGFNDNFLKTFKVKKIHKSSDFSCCVFVVDS